MATLKDIARECGVSVATVSKALNHLPDIGLATSVRIRQAATEMGYMPNAAALAMKTGKSKTIGMLMFLRGESIWTHQYFSKIAGSIHAVTEAGGYDLTPINCNGASLMGSYLNYCRYRNYDGLIVMSGGFSEPTLLDLVDGEIPLVTIDYEFHQRGAVISDNVQGMRDLVTHVYALGHRNLAFIHGEDTSVTHSRLASFYRTCEDLGLSVPPSHVIPSEYRNAEACSEATRTILALKDGITCIFYPDDFACANCVHTLTELGYSVPDDISVVGYDGIDQDGWFRPRLTTMQQDCTGIGTHAARMLLHAIEKPKSFIPKHVLLPGTLRKGDSVKDLNGTAR